MARLSALIVTLVVATTLYIDYAGAQDLQRRIQPCCQVVDKRHYVGLDTYKRPVYRTVKNCQGSCTSRSSTRVIQDGGNDNFVGAQSTSPSELFLNSILLDGRSLSLYFDRAYPWDRWTAHTIRVSHPAPYYCADILRIQFKFCVKASRSWLAHNDYIFIWNPQPESDSLLWGSYIRDLPTAGTGFGRNQYRCHTSTYQPGHPIFQYIITYGDLNVAIQDDTFFDYTQLTLTYDTTSKSCHAVKVRQRTEAISLSTGLKTVKLEDHLKCECQDHSRCNRFTYNQTYYENSYFEQQVDVGKCAGSCRSYYAFAEETDKERDVVRELDNAKVQLSEDAVKRRFQSVAVPYIPYFTTTCQPLKTHVEYVKGPNGGHCVEVIDRCSCAQRCYRKVHYEEYVEVIATGSSYRERRRVYNVGKCVGECASKQECVPLSYYNYPTILLRDGSKKQVRAIRWCGCK